MLPLGLEPRLIESKPIVITTYTKRAGLHPTVQTHHMCLEQNYTPSKTRTCNLSIRSRMRYPIAPLELYSV